MTFVRRVPMPEGGAEREVAFHIHHNCPSAKALRAALENPDVDLLQYSVGLFGMGVPTNTPFAVTSTNPCGVCGKYLTAWFEWAGPRVFLP